MLPLDGITVVSLEQAIAAPFATRHLADLGARVIKVERPGGGDFARGYDATVHGQSSHFVWVNRSKESLTLDLKQPAAAAILQALLDRADVFVQNLSPGAVDRLGFGAEALQARNPGLVICGISGYGVGGTYESKKAYDLLIQAESGLLSVTGNGEAPAKVGVSIADISAGMYAYSNILAALLERQRTGRGRVIEVSMLEALGEWMGYPFYYSRYGGKAPERNGAQHATIAPYGPFRTGDGKQIVMGIQNDREWARFCSEVLDEAALAEDPRFSSNARRVENNAALDERINGAFQRYALDELEQVLEAQQIACARMRDMEAFAEHPQLKARGRWTSLALPGGATVDALLPPGCADESACVMGPPPAVGEHNTAILGELGYSDDDIGTLSEQQVI